MKSSMPSWPNRPIATKLPELNLQMKSIVHMPCIGILYAFHYFTAIMVSIRARLAPQVQA